VTDARVSIVAPPEIAARLARGQRLLGLDVGTKTIGIAISDGTLSVASPLETLKRTRFTLDAKKIADIVAKRDAGGIVIGLPVNMDGSEGPRSQSVRQFAADIARATGLPVTLWDERLSTAAVTRAMIEADVSRARRAELVDKMAAAYILEGLLDHLRAIRRRQPDPREPGSNENDR
jgi:putative Holliday junction resolvase